MVAEPDGGWNWADEELRPKETVKKASSLRSLAKMILFFADEAVVLVILAYLLYKLFL
jgi:hypothetical protein